MNIGDHGSVSYSGRDHSSVSYPSGDHGSVSYPCGDHGSVSYPGGDHSRVGYPVFGQGQSLYDRAVLAGGRNTIVISTQFPFFT